MKWLRTLVVFDEGGVSADLGWRELHESVVRSVESIEHPIGSGLLRLRRKRRKPNDQWERNGVAYLKQSFFNHLVRTEGWVPEAPCVLDSPDASREFSLYPSGTTYRETSDSSFGGFDFVSTSGTGGTVAIEWETGNISSSHRSMNKLVLALVTGKIQVGLLVVPSRATYEHLTDRIGNISELAGYLPMWESARTRVQRGLLAILVVEHDELTDDPGHTYLPVGNSGMAAVGRTKQKVKKARK